MENKPTYVAILAANVREQDALDDFQTRVNNACDAGYVLHSTHYFTSTSVSTIGPIHNFLAHMVERHTSMCGNVEGVPTRGVA